MNIKRLIAAIIIATITLFSTKTFSEGLQIDPNITQTLTLTCSYPTEREDGEILTADMIAKVNFFVSSNKVDPSWIPAGVNVSACKQVYSLINVPDGQYYYSVSATDLSGRESSKSSDAATPSIFAMLIKRQSSPKSPTGLSGAGS